MKNIFSRIRSYLEGRKAMRELPIDNAIFTILDTETTGLNVNEGHKILSFGAVKIKNDSIINNEILDEFVNPERDIPFASRNIHYITEDKVKDKPNIFEIEKKISDFIENTILVGHNIDFDINIIKSELFRLNKINIIEIMNNKKIFCTMKYYENQFNKSKPSLAECYFKLYNKMIAGAHNSKYDIVYTMKIFEKYLKNIKKND